jgi:hypothetical protein
MRGGLCAEPGLHFTCSALKKAVCVGLKICCDQHQAGNSAGGTAVVLRLMHMAGRLPHGGAPCYDWHFTFCFSAFRLWRLLGAIVSVLRPAVNIPPPGLEPGSLG